MPAPVTTAVPLRLRVTGMTCQGCVRNATQALEGVPGVARAQVSLDPGQAVVHWQPDTSPNPPAAIAALKAVGFDAQIAQASADDPGQEPGCSCREAPASPSWSPLEGWRFNVVFGGAITLALLVGEWVFGLGSVRWFQWVAFVGALPVQLVCGARFYRGAWNQLRAGRSNMDTLVALGSTAAFGYSTWGLFAGTSHHLYFMESAAIVTLISVGHWLEQKATDRAASALRSLLNLAPPQARWLSAAGVETLVPVARLGLGDRVLLKPGDVVPVDGEVLEGQSTVDESMLTGESVPLEKTAGARLYAGTLNQEGRLVMRVTATGESTALARIIAVVERAQNSRAAIQRLADRVSSVFVPVVVIVAILTGLVWGLAFDQAFAWHQALARYLWHAALPGTALAAGLIHAAAVLIVACPCAMGLATPAAIMAGANVAARRGILIRDSQALEKSGRVTTVVFDKTGTLTQGRMTVAAVEDCRPPEARSASIRALAARLAAPSAHPSSQAIAAFAREGPSMSHEARDEPRLGARVGDPQRVAREPAWPAAGSGGGPTGLRLTEPRSGTAVFMGAEQFKKEQGASHEPGTGLDPDLDLALDPDRHEGIKSKSKNPTQHTGLQFMAAEHVQRERDPSSDPGTPSGGVLARSDVTGALASSVAQADAPGTPANWQEVRGHGVQARVDDRLVRLGALAWIERAGVPTAAHQPFVAEWTSRAATIVALAEDDRLVGLFALQDQIKPHAASVVRSLEQTGKRVYLLTGDHARTAAAVAAQAGIPADRVFAEVRPERKAEILAELQQRGERVAFVGDGINDAPALAQADLGIAVNRASDVAREAADLILLRPDIEAIPEALGLAQATLRTIRQNLWWAFFYNAAAVPLAALGFLSPVLCAAAMGLSDLLVIGNALRLRRWRAPRLVDSSPLARRASDQTESSTA